ncbi:proteasome subunit beta type-7-A-like [Camellia sinensis]|uniref:proteasome subunit beta type-7-A-like n=1 Tax=Camellia sinensis TaxID=4442 RepID=UPI00103695EF|nr:proteasome subunit beta type-7-A-like [Camellia sinensis]
MSKAAVDVPLKGGFSFDLCRRNEMLSKKGLQAPKFLKTDGVILGVDTRATERPIVADKNCEKIHFMVPNIYCCGAGTAGDTEVVTSISKFNFYIKIYVFVKLLQHYIHFELSF